MYTLLRNPAVRNELIAEAPSLAVAAVTAETTYKFHSFTTECLAFLATWFVVSYVFTLARSVLSKREQRI
jgi:hypothetical protein